MFIWSQYANCNEKIALNDRVSYLIVREIVAVYTDFFGCNKPVRRTQTRLIKDCLALLGKKKVQGKPSYQVYANGLSDHLQQVNGGDFKNTEWLFDLHWYKDGKEPYTTTCLPLVMECEWNPKRKSDSKVPFSGIKYDFQKLLVSNGELRLMVFKVKKKADLDSLSQYFEQNIQNYEHLAKGAKFLFIAFNDREKIIYYSEFSKR